MGLLFPDPKPPAVAGIDLRLGDVRDLLSVRGARLVAADPPWVYDQDPGGANPETNGIYDTMTEADITAILDAAYDCGSPGSRLACWVTWPKLAEFPVVGGAGPRWRYVSGGAWFKQGGISGGVGYHWRGWTEPVLVYVKGAPGRPNEAIRNAAIETKEQHSRKPVGWLREWVRAWTDPGDLVLDLWAGTAPLALACALEGRRYVGAEIDPERHADAMGALHRGLAEVAA
jgi:N6-adenosine-specific RNA methylase IME4